MLRSLTWKLTLAFSLVALTAALLLAVFIRFSSAEQLDRLIIEQQRNDLQSRLVTYYQTNGSWQGVREYVAELSSSEAHTTKGEAHGPGEGRNPAFRRDRRELFGLADAQGVVLIPLLPDYAEGAQVSTEVLAAGEAIEIDGAVVGTILTAKFSPGLNPEETAYLERINVALLWAAGGAVLVALLVGVLLARTLARPLHALTQATHRMAGGELEQEVQVKSSDEIGELASAFNQMSREVARAHKARRQMTADVAHELRTPLTVIAGYVESMREGVLSPTPERLSVIYAEIERLQHLVGDLRVLSQADAGELKLNCQPLAPHDLLQQTRAAFEHQAAQNGVRLDVRASGDLPAIHGDEVRLMQVLGNLISNALRYTPSGGRITLSAEVAGDQMLLTVQDTGQGIAPDDLPFIFDRFYRADQARAEEDGESGLGLAIVKALVDAHGGSIQAASLLGQGTILRIRLPVGH